MDLSKNQAFILFGALVDDLGLSIDDLEKMGFDTDMLHNKSVDFSEGYDFDNSEIIEFKETLLAKLYRFL